MDSTVMELRIKQWLPLFEEQAKSGLNKQDWCEQNGINRSRFFKWQRICRSYLLAQDQVTQGSAQETTFVELLCPGNGRQPPGLAVPSAPDLIPPSSITISCNGFSVSLDGKVDEDDLARVLRVIAHAD